MPHTGLMSDSDTTWMDNLEVRCRCGQVGKITGVEGADTAPENIWVTHPVGLSLQTHIHRQPQMAKLMAQIAAARARASGSEPR